MAKTLTDLYCEFAKVVEIFVAAGLDKENAYKGVRHDGTPLKGTPNFRYPLAGYTFAIGILEGKPVFVGDTVYTKNTSFTKEDSPISVHECGDGIIVSTGGYGYSLSLLTWNKSKPITFTLGDEVFPMPVETSPRTFDFFLFDKNISFTSFETRNKFVRALYSLYEKAIAEAKGES